MASYNRLVLVGNLTRDIELKTVGADNLVGNGGLAVNETRGKKENQTPMFIDFDVWGKQAEVMAQYASRGSKILLEGRLRLEQWQDRDGGGNRSKHKMTVENFQFLDSKGDSEDRGGSAVGGGRHQAPADGVADW